MKIFMISISDNEISQYYKNLVLPSWTQLGYEVEQFEATTPKDLPGLNVIPFLEYKKPRGRHRYRFTDTEKSIWYSHYRLWQKCLDMNEPIHVIEHDTWIFDPLPYFEEDGEDIFLFSFYEESFGSRHKGLTDTVAPCAGYYITPKAARDLVEWVHKNPVDLNVDWAVHDVFEDYHTDTQRNIVLFQKYITPSVVCRQIKHGEVGTTIEHNVSH